MITKTLTLQELKEKLNTLIECDALELVRDQTDTSLIYIPYMMNDALEYYFILEDCMILGDFLPRLSTDAKLQAVSTKDDYSKCSNSEIKAEEKSDAARQTPRHGLIFRTSDDATLTIWFSKSIQNYCFYQYHRIGHFWTKGMEHWRRLVYIIGTIHEKYTFLGEDSCNTLEKELLPLIEFAPFRYWSPLHESLDDYYIDSPDGILCMKKLALEANDFSYAHMVQFYARLPKALQSSSRLIAYYAQKLAAPKHNTLYEYLCKKIEEASQIYAPRDYDMMHNLEIENIRSQFTQKLYADGYTGQYPSFVKGNETLLALEEHPFTILESDTFKFRIHGLCKSSAGIYSLYKETSL